MSTTYHKAGRMCSTPGCPRVDCTAHGAKAQRRPVDPHRGSAHERGYDNRWQKARKAYLAAHPLCTAAQRAGHIEAANVVDHVRPHRGDRKLFWDSSNWQSLSRRAHERKTARENKLIPCDAHGQATAMVQGASVCRDCGGDA